MRIVLALALTTVLILTHHTNTLNASLSEADIEGLYDSFPDQDKHLSPVNGLVVLNSGVLANVRFNGRYGSLNQNYLCHYTITNPPRHTPTFHIDSPHDCTTSIIQQLFPSPAGGRLLMPGAHGDLFRKIPIRELGKILNIYNHHKLGNAGKVQSFESYFSKLIFGNRQKGSWFLNNKDRKEFKKLWGTAFDFDTLPQKYATIFQGAIQEHDQYPSHLIEHALLALAWIKANKKEDLRPLLEEIGYGRITLGAKQVFSKDYYKNWQDRNTVDLGGDGNIDISGYCFMKLMEKPEEMIFMTLGYDHFASPYPCLLGTGNAIHKYVVGEKDKYQSFSDCGESSLRNFFNLMLSDSKKRIFDVEHLKRAFPHASLKLIQFFKYNDTPGQFSQDTFESVNGGYAGRSAWANVVSSLNSENDSLKVDYRQAEGRCNISSKLGIDNMLTVIEKLIGESLRDPTIENGNERRAAALTTLLSKFSKENKIWSWKVKKGDKEINNSLDRYADILISLNDQDLFKWSFMKGHFELCLGSHSSSSDWRKNELLPLLMNEHLPAHLKKLLLPFYLDERSSLDDYRLLSEKGCLYELLYGAEINGVEEKFQVLDDIIQFNHKVALSIMPYWLNKLPLEDRAINGMLVSFLFKYRDLMHENNFILENHPILYDNYVNALKNLHQGELSQDLFMLMKTSPYCEDLVISALQNKDAEQIASFQCEYSEDEETDSESENQSGSAQEDESESKKGNYSLLDYAIDESFPKLVHFLLEKAGHLFINKDNFYTIVQNSSWGSATLEVTMTFCNNLYVQKIFSELIQERSEDLSIFLSRLSNMDEATLWALTQPYLRDHVLNKIQSTPDKKLIYSNWEEDKLDKIIVLWKEFIHDEKACKIIVPELNTQELIDLINNDDETYKSVVRASMKLYEDWLFEINGFSNIFMGFYSVPKNNLETVQKVLALLSNGKGWGHSIYPSIIYPSIIKAFAPLSIDKIEPVAQATAMLEKGKNWPYDLYPKVIKALSTTSAEKVKFVAQATAMFEKGWGQSNYYYPYIIKAFAPLSIDKIEPVAQATAMLAEGKNWPYDLYPEVIKALSTTSAEKIKFVAQATAMLEKGKSWEARLRSSYIPVIKALSSLSLEKIEPAAQAIVRLAEGKIWERNDYSEVIKAFSPLSVEKIEVVAENTAMSAKGRYLSDQTYYEFIQTLSSFPIEKFEAVAQATAKLLEGEWNRNQYSQYIQNLDSTPKEGAL